MADKKQAEKSERLENRGERLHIRRMFTKPDVSPYDQVEWDKRSAVIKDSSGTAVFEQYDIEVPKTWTQLATNIVASKYFRGAPDSPEREYSARQLIGRVADTISDWARDDGYLDKESESSFRDELTFLLLNQYAAFNSPVWFNVGVVDHPQCSACFINSVEDSMEGILDLCKIEGTLFKYGSGTGTNFSVLRGSQERLHGGGVSSGPISFMKGFDAFAGVIKSGGRTRRAAKMVILDADHPDIEDFIDCKVREERKAWTLIDGGYGSAIDGEAYTSIFFQNANHSVRVTNDFMNAVEQDDVWHVRNRLDGSIARTYKARDIMRKIVESTYLCGDPGLQFDTTINNWHTCKTTDRIYASNPCSEYMFLDDSACNLASLNLMKFRKLDGTFDVEKFNHAVAVLITAMEVIVDRSSYPTPKIGKNSHDYRPLGLGYANLGALLMSRGLPYDSEEGRGFAASVTALLCGSAYRQSAMIASLKGPFAGFRKNSASMLGVMRMHRAESHKLPQNEVSIAAKQSWEDVVTLGEKFGIRNAQATVLAPTGTIGFLMDCDTTGVEPDIALIKYKKLVGGGSVEIVNNTVPLALDKLGYSPSEKQAILSYLKEKETIEGAPHLLQEHLPVFDCAFKPTNGSRSIKPMGHVDMMAATQPFLSGAISKTVNIPNHATYEDIEHAYIEAWKKGLKAIAIYRDGCKRSQPLNTSKSEQFKKPVRRRLPSERQAITHKFSIGGHEGYVTVGLYEDGSPGEVFITMSKEGSTISGLMDSFATSLSIALQYGVPLDALARKLTHTRYEPSGFTGNKDIPMAKSITDYLFRWLGNKFLDIGDKPLEEDDSDQEGFKEYDSAAREEAIFETQSDAPSCADCGSIMIRNGSCYKCTNCGTTSGCS